MYLKLKPFGQQIHGIFKYSVSLFVINFGCINGDDYKFLMMSN